MRAVALWLSNGLIALGVLILVATAGLFGYSLYEEAQVSRQLEELKPAVADAWTPAPVESDTPTPAPVMTPAVGIAAADDRQSAFVPWALRSVAGPTQIPTATPKPALPAIRIVATSIRLDARVVEAPVVNGQWEVPKFAAGHLQGTAQPTQGGNVAMAGHVESISSGDVFANIRRMHRGDVVRVYTKASVVTYQVETVETVPNNDLKVLAPTPHEVLTLITCTGTWLPLERDYSERTVVVATRVG